MKTWENWSIDCGDKDESKVVISGSASSLDRVYIDFASGAEAGDYIITYNDGIRCITKTYTVAGAPCSCTITSSYPSTNAHSSAAETSSFVVGTINDSNCEEIIITYVEEESNGDWLSCESLEIDENNNITSSGLTENDSDSTRYATYSFSCGGTLKFYQKGTVVTCDCDSFAFEGTLETEGLSYFAKITNNTSSPINVTAIGFKINESGEEEFHNTQVIAANSTAYYNDGNPICLESCDNAYTTANISDFYIEIDDAQYTATCDKTIIGDGDTITLRYNG